MNRRASVLALAAASFGVAWWPVVAMAAPAATSVTTDGKVGTTSVNLSGTGDIPMSAGSARGGNLLHSFQTFNVKGGDTITFQSDASIANILARVTGGSPSEIAGILAANANLYLMNPSGVIFSGGATLNIKGSFFATTADSIRLGPTERFMATGDVPAAGLMLPPSGFGFSGATTKEISVKDATLRGADGTTLGFVGGRVHVENSKLDVEGGEVLLAGVRSGTLSAATAGRTTSQLGAGSQGGAVSLSAQTAVGSASNLGRMVIRGGTLALDHSSATVRATQAKDGVFIALQRDYSATASSVNALVQGDFLHRPALSLSAQSATLTANSALAAGTLAPGRGGDLHLELSGRLTLAASSIVLFNAAGKADGDLLVHAASAEFDDQGKLFGQNLGTVQPGLFKVAIDNDLTLRGGSAIALSSARGSLEVDAGRLTLDGVDRDGTGSRLEFNDATAGQNEGLLQVTVRDELTVRDGAQIQAVGAARAGRRIEIDAGDVLLSGAGAGDRVTTGIVGDSFGGEGTVGGTIHLHVRNDLQVLAGATIDSNTLGPGAGGTISIEAQNLTVTGRPGAPETDEPRGLTAKNGGFISGTSGDITLRVGTLTVQDGGVIDASTLGTGRGGNITVHGDVVEVASGGRITAETSGIEARGPGGDITLRLSDALRVLAGGSITVSTIGFGVGGDLDIQAPTVLIQGIGAEIAARSGTPTDRSAGAGGNIIVDAGEIEISSGGQVTASAYGSGAGGNVDLRGGDVRLERGGSIQSSSAADGFAGEVRVSARDLTLTGGSSISVAAAESNAGDLMLRASGSIRLTDSSVTSQAALNGGSVSLQARDLLFLRDSRLTAAAGLTGGNINVDPTLVVLDHSLIDARATFVSGGNILLRSDFYLAEPASLVTATSEKGIDGEVEINALHIDLTGSLVELPSRLLDAESMLRDLCTMKLDDFSSFVKEGRGGVPPAPGGLLPSLEIVR